MTAVKGIRKDGANTTSLEALTATAVNVLTVTTGRTFVMTDLIITGRTTAVTTPLTMPLVRLYDETAGGSTAPAVAAKFTVAIPTRMAASVQVTTATGTTGTAATLFVAEPLIITNIQNGPEFSTAVSAASLGFTHFIISAHAIWCGGVER